MCVFLPVVEQAGRQAGRQVSIALPELLAIDHLNEERERERERGGKLITDLNDRLLITC